MSGIDVLVLRRSIRLVHSLRKERAQTCGFMISNSGDIRNSALASSISNKQYDGPIFQSFQLSRKMTDAAMGGLDGIQSKPNVELYNSLLFMARLVLEDTDSMVELKEESSSLGFLSVILSETFQMSLMKYNNIIIKLLESGILPFSPITSNENGNPDVECYNFDVKTMTTKIIGYSSKMKAPISALLKCFFSTLKFLDEYTRDLINSRVSDKNKIGTTEYRISSLFAILIAIINLQESFLIEIICFQQLLSSKDSTNANGVISSFLGNGVKENPQVAAIVKILLIHFDYQQKLIQTLKMAANDIDMSTCKSGDSVFSDLLERSLQQNEKISALKEFVLKNDKKMKEIKKVITNDDLLKLSISRYERFHGLELSIIEEIEYCQIISDEVHPSLLQNKLVNKKSMVWKRLSLSKRSKTGKKKLKEATVPFANLSKVETKKLIGEMSPELMKSTLMSILNIELERSKSTSSNNDDEEGIDEEDASLPLHLVPVVNEWQVDLDELKFKKRIGDGGAGTTYLSKWRREDVAVKVAAATSLGMFGWKKELEFLKNLHHPNVVRMLGCVYSETPFAMILVLVSPRGDLGGILNRATPKNFFEKASLGLANGLSYLHSKGIFHRDVKPDNILVHGDIEKGDFCVKIIDFGLSVFFDVRKYNANLRRSSVTSMHSLSSIPMEEDDYTAEAGTYRWMAPEIIRHQYYDFKCDTYSFGIVLWQLLTREKPYANKGQEDAAKSVSENLARPPFPKNTPRKIQNLIEKCWSNNPSDRPFCDALCDMIETIMDDLNKDERKWLSQSYGHQVYSKMKVERPNNTGITGDKDSKVRKRFSRKGSKIFRLSLSLK